MSTRLEYWDATPPSGNPRWTQATISYGSATNNAVLNCDIVERLGRSRQAKVTLMNQGTAFNTVGPFTNEFTDFQRIRVLDDDVNVVLFHGRIYGIKVHTDAKFGDVTTIECYDMLRELQEYPTEHFKTPIQYGASTGQFNKNSTLIKSLIASDYAIDSSANIGSGSITFSDTDRFETSAVTLDQDNYPAYYPNRGEKNVLGQVASIARQDPHSGATYEDQFGYDYYLDSSFDKTTDYIASSNATLLGDTFNYFKRGTRPSTPGTPGTDGINWKGLRIHRPTTTFSETGNLIAMLDGAGFEKPKDDLFTSVILQFDETTVASTVGGNYDDMYDYGWGNSYVQPHVASHDGRFLVEGIDGGTFGGSNSGVFKWQGRKFSRLYEVSVNAESTDNVAAEFLTSSHTHGGSDTSHGNVSHGGGSHSHQVGTVVYTSATSSTGLFLITFEESYMEKTFNYFCDNAGSTVVLTGENSGATYTFTPSTHRMKTKFGIQRPYRMQISASKYLDAIRQEAANALSKSVLPQMSGRFRTLRAPYYYVDMYADTHDGTDNTITITHIKQNSGSFTAVGTPSDNTLANWGLKEGMTIAKVDSNGTQTAWGWITDITGAAITSNIRNATHDGDENWDLYTGSSNIIRVYMPVRTGHYTYIVNDAQAVDGYHFVEEVGYTETQGAIGTNYKTYGTNSSTYTYEGPFKSKLPEVIVAIDETSKNIGKLHDTPVSLMPWSFTQADGSGETGKFTINSRTNISWTAGLLDIGGVYKYKIRAGTGGDSATLVTTTTGQMDGLPYEYVISFDSDQTPDGNSTYEIVFTLRKDYIDDVDKIKMGWARAGETADDDAQLVFDSSIGDFSIKTKLSAISENLGTITRGTGYFGSGAVYNSNLTGIALGDLADTTGGGDTFTNVTLAAQTSGASQVFISGGKLYAGAGNVLIDALGINIAATPDGSNTRGLRFKAADPMGSRLLEGRVLNTDATQFHWTGYSGLDEIVWNNLNFSAIASLQTNNSDGFFIKLPGSASAAAAGDYLDVASGSGTIGSPYQTRFQNAKLIFNGTSASMTSSYGIFRYAYDGNSNANDTLAFTFNQQSATPASNTAQSVFWIMQSISDYLILEPNLPYGTTNYAWIGKNNPLVGMRSYYIQAGAGNASGPSISFYTDTNTGFYSSTSDTINIALGGVNKYQFSTGYLQPTNDGIIASGHTSYRWDTVYSQNGVSTVSDAREKTDILPVPLGLDFIKSLNPVSYKWKEKPNTLTHYGILAQEVLETLKDFGIDSMQDFSVITGDEDTRYGANYTEFIPILIKAIQELSDKIKKLEEGE